MLYVLYVFPYGIDSFHEEDHATFVVVGMGPDSIHPPPPPQLPQQ
jgi:hypothetical protein